MRLVPVILAVVMVFLLTGISEPNLEFCGGCASTRPVVHYVPPNIQETPSYFNDKPRNGVLK